MPFQRDQKQLNKFSSRDTDYEKVLNAITTCIRVGKKETRKAAICEQPGHSEERRLGQCFPGRYGTRLISIECLRSLGFPHIDDRRHDIALAHQDTCDWLFKTEQFQQWRDRYNLLTHNGVLWIKGKPGAGKLTLMKHILSHCQKAFTNHVIGAYFFNARGSKLGKTPLGMFRSLLYQLLEKDPRALCSLVSRQAEKA
ncbi:MAG: hypothetical protein M1840_008595 [Geoglossum simile]|nr:MAG: hypothetical protein M1840_008595 [Geoglossum simile]